ncbi:hypothetical protein YC2023_095612 [Brassica napus]
MSFRSKFSAPPLYPWKRNGLRVPLTRIQEDHHLPRRFLIDIDIGDVAQMVDTIKRKTS